MEKITKKRFAEIISTTKSALIGNANQNDSFMVMYMGTMHSLPENLEWRSVEKVTASYIRFSNGSKLLMDQKGIKEYYIYKNNYGITFLLQKLIYDIRDWDAEEKYWQEHRECVELYKKENKYVLYAI